MKKIVFLFLFGLILNNVIAQHSVTLKQVTLDSLRPRIDTIHVKGKINVEDTLYLQDTSIYDVMQRYVSEGTITLGTANQVTFVNSTGTDLGYSDNFKWNDTTLTLEYGSANIFIGQDAGKLVVAGGENILIGKYAGSSNVSSSSNIYIGHESGKLNTSNTNTFIGYRTGDVSTGTSGSVLIGHDSGGSLTTGNSNTFIGKESGYSCVTGNANIFIGNQSGYSELGSNKLYIENSNSSTPLIWGDFANDSVRINGTLDVTGNVIVKGIMNIAKAEVLYTDTSQTTIVTLPTNAVIWDIKVEVVQGFNDTGLNRLYVGITGDYTKYTYGGRDGDYLVVMNAIWTSGRNLPDRLAASTNIIFTYDGENSDATQGQAFVYIYYSLH